ncbi:sensor histidine kinase [Alistipes sp. ZOR0009]|uniref:sensor histidine kinase n=1 Tax=Alistipes sp. ZOR0009 TaxID=1339253 RepID=UPI0006462C3A|nr:HAMP domain-containing sensor histidine kinase [Alistipes sp. ZOR0009]
MKRNDVENRKVRIGTIKVILIAIPIFVAGILFLFLKKAYDNELDRFSTIGNMAVSNAFFSTATASQNISSVTKQVRSHVELSKRLTPSEMAFVKTLLKSTLNDFSKVDSVVQSSLRQRGVGVSYGYRFFVDTYKVKADSGYATLVGRGGFTNRLLLYANGKPITTPLQNSFYLFSQDSYICIVLESEFIGTTRYLLSQMVYDLILSLILLLVAIAVVIIVFRVLKYQSQLLEMKTDFVNNVTHEFNTPLSTIMISTNALSTRQVSESPIMVLKQAEMIKKQSYRLQKMLDNVVFLSDFTTSNTHLAVQPTDMELFIYECMAKYQHQENLHISITTKGNKVPVLIDEFYFTSVFNNLVDNSIKYCNKTPVCIDVAIETGTKRMQIRFADNGDGLNPRYRNRIFAKFVRLNSDKGNTKGVGLGLYLVRKVVAAHGGTVTLDRNSATTCFIVTLPIQQQ